MPQAESRPTVVRFGAFELDLHARELRKQGRRIRLQDKPYEVLAALLERPGEIVTREDLRHRLWPAGTFVIFDENLNAAVRKLREALGDSAGSPRFVETVPRHGYRFLAPVHCDPAGKTAVPSEAAAVAGTGPVALDDVWGGSGAKVAWFRRAAAILLPVALLGAGAAYRLALSPVERGRALRLVVLPLENLSGDPAQDYLSKGLTEDLTTALARVSPDRLHVIARASAAQYAAANDRRMDRLRAELDVDHVIEGSVRRTGDGIRLVVQLTDPRTQAHVWARTFDMSLEGLGGIEEDVTRDVAAALRVPAAARREPARRGTRVATARDAYLKGRHLWNLRTKESVPKAIEYFRAAIASDPAYAAAHAGLADAEAFLSVVLDVINPREARERAYAAALHAVAVDPLLPEAHASLAMVRCRFDWDWPACAAGLQKVLQLDPGFATAHHWHGVYLMQMGRLDESRAALERALALDPLSTIITTALGISLMYAGDYEGAMARLESAIELSPGSVLPHRALGNTYTHKGDFAKAVATLQHAASLAPTDPHAVADLGYAYARAGRRNDALRALARIRRLAAERHVSAYDFAVVNAGLGNRPDALAWLEQAYAQRATGMPYLRVDPMFRDLRGEARFVALLRKLGLAGAATTRADSR